MAMCCNLDKRGRRIRGTIGTCIVIAGLLTIGLTWPPTAGQWVGGAGLTLFGSFILFEALKGWCAAKAMGIRTPF